MSTEANEELELLKERADLMGIKYSPNIGVNGLKAKIAEATEPEEETEDKSTSGNSKVTVDKVKDMKKEAGKLVRFTLSCNDPQFAKRGGILKHISNSHIEFGKFIPFDVEFHAPQMIVDHLKNCTYIKSTIVKDKNTGRKTVKHSVAKQFVVDVLPPLTKEELEALAADQARTGAVE